MVNAFQSLKNLLKAVALSLVACLMFSSAAIADPVSCNLGPMEPNDPDSPREVTIPLSAAATSNMCQISVTEKKPNPDLPAISGTNIKIASPVGEPASITISDIEIVDTTNGKAILSCAPELVKSGEDLFEEGSCKEKVVPPVLLPSGDILQYSATVKGTPLTKFSIKFAFVPTAS